MNITFELEFIAKIIDIFHITMVLLAHRRKIHQTNGNNHQILVVK